MSVPTRRPLWSIGRGVPINTDDPFISSEKLSTMPRPIDPYHLSNIQPVPSVQAFRAGDWQSVSPEHLERTGSSGLVREMRPKRTYDMVDVRPTINTARIYTQVDHAESGANYIAHEGIHTPTFPVAHPPAHLKRRRQHDVLEDQYSAPKWDHHTYHRQKIGERMRMVPTCSYFNDGQWDDSPCWPDAHRPRAHPSPWSNSDNDNTNLPTPAECPSPTLGYTARFEDISSTSLGIGTPPPDGSASPLRSSGADFSSWFSGIQSSPRLSGFKPYRPSIGLMLSETEKEARVHHCANELGGLGLVVM